LFEEQTERLKNCHTPALHPGRGQNTPTFFIKCFPGKEFKLAFYKAVLSLA
jgi:hypothetical protein